jgi:hypothetical protein
MDSERFLKVILASVLILMVILLVQAAGPLAGAQKSSSATTGMGDLQRYAAQPSTGSSEPQGKLSAYVGMGDLQRFEAQP